MRVGGRLAASTPGWSLKHSAMHMQPRARHSGSHLLSCYAAQACSMLPKTCMLATGSQLPAWRRRLGKCTGGQLRRQPPPFLQRRPCA